jgi:hypothetical protein
MRPIFILPIHPKTDNIFQFQKGGIMQKDFHHDIIWCSHQRDKKAGLNGLEHDIVNIECYGNKNHLQ